MTRYPQALSLTTVVVVATSCSLPLLRERPPTEQEQAAVLPLTSISTVPIDFRRVPISARCPPGGCRKPTLKTLAVDYQPTTDFSGQPQLAVAKLLNEPHSAAAPTAATPIQLPVRTSAHELNVYFGYADATLPKEARDKLNEAVRDRASLQRVSIRGRTDGQGASPANQRLALSRANAVRQHLLARDPSLATLIEVEARGSCCYVAPNATASGRALNRRVEVTVVRSAADA